MFMNIFICICQFLLAFSKLDQQRTLFRDFKKFGKFHLPEFSFKRFTILNSSEIQTQHRNKQLRNAQKNYFSTVRLLTIGYRPPARYLNLNWSSLFLSAPSHPIGSLQNLLGPGKLHSEQSRRCLPAKSFHGSRRCRCVELPQS